MATSPLALFSILILLYTSGTVISDNLCESGWESYEDSQCIKIFQTPKPLNLYDAEAFCQQQGGSNLIFVNSEEQQTIIAKFSKSKIFTKDINHIIFCEKAQLWSLSKLQETLLKLQKQVENLIPVGFIYVQLPKEQSPLELWPNYTWADVSSDYDGVFFRTIGKDSAPFGEVQAASAPRIVTVQGFSSKNDTGLHTTVDIEANGEFSGIVRTAYENNPAYYFYRGLQFKASADEVRPRNMAVRIWQRTL